MIPRTRTLVVAKDEARGEGVAKCVARGNPSGEVLCSTPTDAVDTVEKARPHVVLLASDGPVIKALREHWADLPIVAIVSNVEDSSEGARVLDEGATDVIVESELEPRLLAWRLRLAVDGHDRERRLRDAKTLAETANARKTEFLSHMSHEIRTPLNTVLGMAELLDETKLDNRQRRYVVTLRRASDHVLALIEDVLDLARIEAGTVTLEDTGFDLYEVVESAIDIVRVQAGRKKLDLGWSASLDVPRELRGDPRRIRQVLVNLLNNAVKFTDQGRVWLGVERDKAGADPSHASLHVTVTDTGMGIPRDRLEAIFSGFVQADGTIGRRYGGFGLGLSISKRVVERMGGRVWVESTPNKGSTFHITFSLPIERGAVAPTFAEVKPTVATKLRALGDRRIRVLVVDDSEDNRILLGEYLQSADVDVEFADDGPSALDKGTTQTFDVILMDLQMPQLDGYETTRELLRRMRERNMKPPPVIALSAHVLSESFARSIDAGCAMQLTKPIRKRVLLEAVARAAGARAIEARDVGVARGPMRDEILPLLPKFFANRRNDVRVIRDALERHDYHSIATLAHNMRGTGASYGFPDISALGDSLQESGKRQNEGEILHLASELEHLLDRFEAQYGELAAKASADHEKKVPPSVSRVRITPGATEPTGSDKH